MADARLSEEALAELIERLRASVTPMDVKQGLFTEHYVTPIPICLEAADALAALTRELEEARGFGANELRFAENALIGIEEAFANTGIRVPKSLSAAIGRAARSADRLSRTSAVRQADARPLHEHDGEHDEH